MNARELSGLVAAIDARHAPGHGDGCDACVLLSALRTAVGRRWDPFTGGPITEAPLDTIAGILAQLQVDWTLYGEVHATNAGGHGLLRLDPARITYSAPAAMRGLCTCGDPGSHALGACPMDPMAG